MRFIIRYKYGILQKKSERIDINNCQTTDQLIAFLENRISKKNTEFIIRYIIDKNTCYRVIHGWTLEHYDIKDGSELQLQTLQQESKDVKNKYQQKYLINLLGQKRKQLIKINEQNQDEDYVKKKKQFNIRKYLDFQCQKLLKLVQKGNIIQIQKLLQDYPTDLQEEYILQIQKNKPKILNQLGQGGWNALHFAIYTNQIQIINQLINRNIDINKCTADGWLPLHLAINRKNYSIIRILISHPQTNINQVTKKGSPLHLAAKLEDIQAMTLLLQKNADWKLTDQKGKNCLQVCQKQQCINLIKKSQQKRILKQNNSQHINQNLAIVKGIIMKTKTLFLSDKYLVLNPFQGTLIMYDAEDHYPRKPKQIIPITYIKQVKILLNEQKSWQMKKQFYYIQLLCPKKFSFALKNYKIADKWLISISEASKYQKYLQSHKITATNNNQQQQIITLDDTNNMILISKKVQKKISPLVKKPTIILNIPKKQNNNSSNYDQISSPRIPNTPNRLSENEYQYYNTKNYSNRQTYYISPTKNNQQNSTSQQSPTNSSIYDSPKKQLNTTKLIPNQNIQTPKKKNNQNQQKQSQKYKQQNQQKKNQQQLQKQTIAKQLKILTNIKINFSTFQIIETLGEGSFGKVFLAKHIHTKKKYALKALKKKTLVSKRQLKYAIAEANVLKQASHPFIVNLHYAFQTPNYLYLALDFCPGKDLSFHLARQGSFSQQDSKIYIAQLLLAIQHLHDKNIIYRDLKPQNILLDVDGHIKLADFGLSKQNPDQKTKSFCGSPAYLSPEMLNQKGGVGKEADIYGIGCVLYQFLVGEPPFFNEDIPTLYQNIKQGKLKFPKSISQQAKDLIVGLLERDPKKRIGSKNKSQLKAHPFFKDIDWIGLQSKEIDAPTREFNDNNDDSDEEMKLDNETNFTDFDYEDDTKKINRLKGFSFVRIQDKK